MTKIITASEVAKLINDEDFVATTSNGLGGLAEEVLAAIEERYLKENHPQDITFVHSCGIGNGTKGRGSDYLAHEGLVKRLIAGHTGTSPTMAQFVVEDKIEAYLLPQGVITHMYRATAGKTPGVFTKVGLNTYVDPRLQGGMINDRTREQLIKLINIDGEDFLHYPPLPINVAIMRGTTADVNGNVTTEDEVVDFEYLPLAMAAKNNGGIVIVQVKNLAEAHTLNSKSVRIPGSLVDYIVVNEDPDYHYQTNGTKFNQAFTSKYKVPLDSVNLEAAPLDARKIIARRAAMELRSNSIVNLGIGIPMGISNIIFEEGVENDITFTLELGTFGGIPASVKDFGAAYNSHAHVPHDHMFDFYDGGGLDTAFLGFAQFDKYGNVNVSKFGPNVAGPGGFINISQSSKKVVFTGTFSVGGKSEIKDQKLTITDHGKAKKIVEKVEQITFSSKYATENNLSVLYITERAVFDIFEGKLRIIEIAPGLDLERDIIQWMDFRPVIDEDLKEMNSDIFSEEWGLLREIMDPNEKS